MIAIGGSIGTGCSSPPAPPSPMPVWWRPAGLCAHRSMVYFRRPAWRVGRSTPVSGRFTYGSHFVDSSAFGFAQGWNQPAELAITVAVELVAATIVNGVVRFSWIPR